MEGGAFRCSSQPTVGQGSGSSGRPQLLREVIGVIQANQELPDANGEPDHPGSLWRSELELEDAITCTIDQPAPRDAMHATAERGLGEARGGVDRSAREPGVERPPHAHGHLIVAHVDVAVRRPQQQCRRDDSVPSVEANREPGHHGMAAG